MLRKTIVTLSFILSIAFSTQAQLTKELILNIPPINEKVLIKIKSQLACIENIKFCGYDAENSCLYLRYDPEYILDPDIISTIVCALNDKMEVCLIEGLTIYDVIDGKLK